MAISQKKFKRELVLHFLPKWAEIWFIGSLGGYYQFLWVDFKYLENWPSPGLALIFLAIILAKNGLKIKVRALDSANFQNCQNPLKTMKDYFLKTLFFKFQPIGAKNEGLGIFFFDMATFLKNDPESGKIYFFSRISTLIHLDHLVRLYNSKLQLFSTFQTQPWSF